jgi:hypothetical protein
MSIPTSWLGKIVPSVTLDREYLKKKLTTESEAVVEAELERMRVVLRDFCGYQWDNNQFLVGASDGTFFKVLLLGGTISIYTLRSVHIADAKYADVAEAFGRMQEYTDGFIHCSKCDDKIKLEDVAGHFYAGSYDKKCWEGKGDGDEKSVKYQAEHENYD